MDEHLATQRMTLAEALTDASRSLDKARRRIEAIIMALQALHSPTVAAHIERCKQGVVELEQLNNSVRRMNT